MTMGTAMVASTKVRTTGESSRSQSPSTRLSAVRVGKTASQIMAASWCFVGGPTGRGVALALDMVLLELEGDWTVSGLSEDGPTPVRHSARTASPRQRLLPILGNTTPMGL